MYLNQNSFDVSGVNKGDLDVNAFTYKGMSLHTIKEIKGEMRMDNNIYNVHNNNIT